MAPSQAAYARPGLPGTQAPTEPPRPRVEDERPLTPEEEVLAEIVASEEAPATEAPAAPAAPAAPEVVRPAAAAPGIGGLRFGDELRIDRDIEDDRGARPAPRRRGRRGRGGPVVERGAAAARPERRTRRFEVSDDEIEEGLEELHGGPDFEDDDDAEYEDE